MLKKITIRKPAERHAHFRQYDGLMRDVLLYTARQSWCAVAMPNTSPPLTKWQLAKTYKDNAHLIAEKIGYPNFKVIMTCYLTDNTDVTNLEEGYKNGVWSAAKLYPLGATTNSDSGVSQIEKIYPVLEKMQEISMPLLIHPETEASRYEIPLLNRERVFVNETLTKIARNFPELNICVEHVTTKESVQFVEEAKGNVVATVTPQHLLYNHDAIFHNGVPPYKLGLYPENMCLPVLKQQEDVDYLRHAVMYGSKRHKFGAGTDSAPHTEEAKHTHGSCCGCYNSYAAVELYATAFEENGAFIPDDGVKVFEGFMSKNNLWIYNLQPSEEYITLVRKEQVIPEILPGNIRPFKAGQTILWSMVY